MSALRSLTQADRGSLLLIALAVLVLLARVPLLFIPALWIDEVFSLYHARLALEQLWGEGWKLESSPPLYYTVLWAWIRLAGFGEVAGRLLALLLSFATLWAIHGATRALAGRRAGAIAALLWTLPAVGIEYSLEIRPYALQLFLIALALWAFVLALNAARERQTLTAGGIIRLVAPVVVLSAATFYTHTTSVAFISGLAVAGLYFGIATRPGWGYFKVWALACLAVAVLCLPQVLAAAGVLDTNRAGLAWIPKSYDLMNLLHVVRQWAIGALYWSYKYSGPLMAVIFLAIAYSGWRLRGQPAVVALGIVLPLIGFTVLVVVGLIQPILLPRTMLWTWLPFVMLIGCCAATLDWRAWRWRLSGGLLMLTFVLTDVAYMELRQGQRPWHDTLEKLAERIQPKDRILVIDPEVACVLDYYSSAEMRALPKRRLELGQRQRFRSGQRLNIVCNQLETIRANEVGMAGERGDWVLVDAFLQRTDLSNLLQQSNGSLRVAEIVQGAGQAQAARVVRSGQ